MQQAARRRRQVKAIRLVTMAWHRPQTLPPIATSPAWQGGSTCARARSAARRSSRLADVII